MSFGDAWRNAANEKIEPPKGTYKTEVVGGNAFTSRDGDDYCKLDLRITEGELEGAQFEHFMGFKHEVGARINREALLAYGIRDPEGVQTIEDLDDRIGELKGTTAEVGVSYKDGYMQVRVNGSRPPVAQQQLSSETTPATASNDFAAAAAKKFGDDVPFD